MDVKTSETIIILFPTKAEKYVPSKDEDLLKYEDKISNTYKREDNENDSTCKACGNNEIDQLNKENKNIDENMDSFELVKKYKELLDIGAITQEEYDKKKKELLNL